MSKPVSCQEDFDQQERTFRIEVLRAFLGGLIFINTLTIFPEFCKRIEGIKIWNCEFSLSKFGGRFIKTTMEHGMVILIK